MTSIDLRMGQVASKSGDRSDGGAMFAEQTVLRPIASHTTDTAMQ